MPASFDAHTCGWSEGATALAHWPAQRSAAVHGGNRAAVSLSLSLSQRISCSDQCGLQITTSKRFPRPQTPNSRHRSATSCCFRALLSLVISGIFPSGTVLLLARLLRGPCLVCVLFLARFGVSSCGAPLVSSLGGFFASCFLLHLLQHVPRMQLHHQCVKSYQLPSSATSPLLWCL